MGQCNFPLAAWQPAAGGSLTFTQPRRGDRPHRSLNVPCGQCMQCRLSKSAEWAQRCVHEATLHPQNCFITLTYNDEHLPKFGSLEPTDLQKFFKRLRKQKGSFRYYACGEYGDRLQRPHYHACLFGMDFNDKIHFRKIGEHHLYISSQLEKIWGHGQVSIGSLTFETAAYTARYVTKKLGKGQSKYNRIDEHGEIIPLVQPFARMSLRSAIGKEWLLKFHQDIYGADKDIIRIRNKTFKPAKYYDKIYDTINPEHLKTIKQNRVGNALKLTPEELRAREQITRARTHSKSQV